MRELSGSLKNYKEQAERDVEFPNPAEGFDKIYEVIDDEIANKRKELIESMKTRPFWHYCEACGKKEFITAQDQGRA